MTDFEIAALANQEIIIELLKLIASAIIAGTMAKLWLDQFPFNGDK